jgi:hypothetical protein
LLQRRILLFGFGVVGRKKTRSSWRWVKSGIRYEVLGFVGELFQQKKLPAARFSAVAHQR